VATPTDLGFAHMGETGVRATDCPAAAILAAARTFGSRSGDGEVEGGRAEGGGTVVGRGST
jgi:hypothetical protein